MGVLTCDRNGCDNIMSDYYVPGAGHVCSECMAEFSILFEFQFPPIVGEYGALQTLKSFMNKPKSQQYQSSFDFHTWAEGFNRHR